MPASLLAVEVDRAQRSRLANLSLWNYGATKRAFQWQVLHLHTRTQLVGNIPSSLFPEMSLFRFSFSLLSDVLLVLFPFPRMLGEEKDLSFLPYPLLSLSFLVGHVLVFLPEGFLRSNRAPARSPLLSLS